jgi:hypothetical protein
MWALGAKWGKDKRRRMIRVRTLPWLKRKVEEGLDDQEGDDGTYALSGKELFTKRPGKGNRADTLAQRAICKAQKIADLVSSERVLSDVFSLLRGNVGDSCMDEYALRVVVAIFNFRGMSMTNKPRLDVDGDQAPMLLCDVPHSYANGSVREMFDCIYELAASTSIQTNASCASSDFMDSLVDSDVDDVETMIAADHAATLDAAEQQRQNNPVDSTDEDTDDGSEDEADDDASQPESDVDAAMPPAFANSSQEVQAVASVAAAVAIASVLTAEAAPAPSRSRVLATFPDDDLRYPEPNLLGEKFDEFDDNFGNETQQQHNSLLLFDARVFLDEMGMDQTPLAHPCFPAPVPTTDPVPAAFSPPFSPPSLRNSFQSNQDHAVNTDIAPPRNLHEASFFVSIPRIFDSLSPVCTPEEDMQLNQNETLLRKEVCVPDSHELVTQSTNALDKAVAPEDAVLRFPDGSCSGNSLV